LSNAVGIMGTSLTEEQVGILERVVTVLELCLDADRAGQDAMLRAARLAESRKLELRVVPLPEGTDPADLIEREGAEALRSLVERSAPFIVFQVERILDRTDIRTAEGRDRALAELRPVLAEQPASLLLEDLLRRVAGQLDLSEKRLASLIAESGRARSVAHVPAAAPVIDEVARAEREFLMLCVSLPADGERMLSSIDPEQLLTSEPLRRAARHLTGRLASPLADLPRDDEQLATTVADLVARAGSAGTVSVEALEHARLLLELGRVERAIRRARGAGSSGISELAREREQVREQIRAVTGRMERAV
jgi:DNA primase